MFKIKYLSILAVCLLIVTSIFSQNQGDTIKIQTFNYESGTRDTIIDFPNDPGISFEKIIMKYNMRCKGARISTSSNRNLGCGEWDYSCNTYITDSSHIDSIGRTHPNYIISNFSGTDYDYVTSPTNTYTRYIQPIATVDSSNGIDTISIGNSIISSQRILPTDARTSKTQFLIRASELNNLGLNAGTIDALNLEVLQNPQKVNHLKIRIKGVTDTILDISSPNFGGLTEVFFHDENFILGKNNFQFHTPFSWNGTDNLIIELSYKNKVSYTDMEIAGDTLDGQVSLNTIEDHNFSFDGGTYVEANNYKGINGGQARTIEAWVKTTGTGELVGWGTNTTSQKCLFRIEGQGRLRYEVSGGNTVGTKIVNDGKWHHVAMVQSGNSINSVQFYVDGVIDSKSSSQNIAINTQPGINLRVNNSFHNLYLNGIIEDVRVWDAALSNNTLATYRRLEIDSLHPNFAYLQVYFKFNEGTGNLVSDHSGNNRDAMVQGNTVWNALNGDKLFKNLTYFKFRPAIDLIQGNFSLSLQNDTVLDTLQNSSNFVEEFQVFSNPASLKSDSVGLISSGFYWEATPEEMYDELGNVVTTFPINKDGTFSVSNLDYWQRSPSAFEIMSFVTPYGIGLDLGKEGETWYYDVSDFAPILKGKQRMYMSRGGQWQEEMDIEFWFIVGTPPRKVLDISQIWRVDAINYQDLFSNRYFEPRDVMILPNGDKFKIRTAITGHGQEGEFIPQNHTVNVNAGSPELYWQVWKECAYNPVYPQGGTWIYDRAGWCPGMATDVQELDITDIVTPGQTANIDYGVKSATGTSRYIINNQLVTYGAANFTNDASVTEIVVPSNKIEFGRMQELCNGPVIEIKNTGGDNLTSLTIKYWVNDETNKVTYAWTGNLASMESELVTLPVENLWNSTDALENKFFVSVSSPNGELDEYPLNSELSNSFDIPDLLPNDFVIWFKSNSASSENNYKIYNSNGDEVWSKSGFAANSNYRDTISLVDGCYTLQFQDTDDDGISFWANNDGSGFLRLYDMTGSSIKTFEPDFGGSIVYTFSVQFPLSYEELKNNNEIKVFPNPASDLISVKVNGEGNISVSLFNQNGQMLKVPNSLNGYQVDIKTEGLSNGVYFLRINYADKVEMRKVVISK